MSTFLDRYPTFDFFRKEALAAAPDIERKREWSTGGSSGGNCWNDNPSVPYTSDEEEPDDTDLDAVLQATFPDLTFLEYRRLSRAEIETRGSYSQNEYYGNYTNYATKQYVLITIYHTLCDISEDRP